MDFYIQITKDCNHDCIFCSAPKTKDFLSYENIIAKIDEFRVKGVGSSNADEFVITGGEPTLHPDLLRVFDYLKNHNLFFRMVSNSVNIGNMDYAKKLVEHGLRRILISYHHVDNAIAKQISSADYEDLPDTFKAIENMDSLGVEININITIIRQNYTVLLDIVKSLVPKFKNVRHFNFNFVDVSGNTIRNGYLGAKDIAPKYSECEKYLYSAFDYLIKHHVGFRFERSPLCYSVGYEKYSSDANRNVGTEFYFTTFASKDQEDTNYNQSRFVKNEDCSVCTLNYLCSGVSAMYANIYGTSELYPSFVDPNKIEFDIKAADPNNKEKAFLKRADSYEFNKLYDQMNESFDMLGGIVKFIKSKRTVLIKPNVLGVGAKNSCTNPEFLRAIIRLLKKNDNKIIVADGPGGFKDGDKAFESSGIKKMCAEENVPLYNLQDRKYVSRTIRNPLLLSSVEISDIIDEVDVIINVPKLKTHGITFLTGAIKNTFGLVSPEARKEIHFHEDKFDFSAGVVDVYSYLKPKIALTILDAIESMEGNEGPLNGETHKSNFFIIARDGLIVDVLASHITGHNITSIPTNLIAGNNKLGFISLDRINLLGDDINSVMCKDFKKNNLFDFVNPQKKDAGFGKEYFYRIIPRRKDCTKCGNCIMSCPTNAIRMTRSGIEIDASKCIYCYTCKELCSKKEFDLIKQTINPSKKC